MNSLNNFLNRLDESGKSKRYRLSKIRADSILVEVFVAGEHWEIEFMVDGSIEIERFRSSGEIYDEKALDEFWRLLEG